MKRTISIRAIARVARRRDLRAGAAFGYAILMGREAVGLVLRKWWARRFTIIATTSLILTAFWDSTTQECRYEMSLRLN